jgi:hypothetical protein
MNLDALVFAPEKFVQIDLVRKGACRLVVRGWQSNDALLGAHVFRTLHQNTKGMMGLCATGLASITIQFRFKKPRLGNAAEPGERRDTIDWNGTTLRIEVDPKPIGELMERTIGVDDRTMLPTLNLAGIAMLPFHLAGKTEAAQRERYILQQSLAYTNPEKLLGWVLADSEPNQGRP